MSANDRVAAPARRVVEAVIATATCAAVYLVAVPQRLDYVGHWLAGFAGTLAVLLVVGADRAHWGRILVATFGCILLGVGTEVTVFRLAIADPIDICNQSLGACLAASIAWRTEPVAVERGGLAALSIIAMIVGWNAAFA